MDDSDRLWMDAFGFVYSGDGKRLLKGANVKGAYWIPEGVEEIEPAKGRKGDWHLCVPANLNALEKKIDTTKMKNPSFRMVLTAVGQYAYMRKDGVMVVPIGCLKE